MSEATSAEIFSAALIFAFTVAAGLPAKLFKAFTLDTIARRSSSERIRLSSAYVFEIAIPPQRPLREYTGIPETESASIQR